MVACTTSILKGFANFVVVVVVIVVVNVVVVVVAAADSADVTAAAACTNISVYHTGPFAHVFADI